MEEVSADDDVAPDDGVERLAHELGRLTDRSSAFREQRRPQDRPLHTLPPVSGRTASELEPWHSFNRAVGELSRGDAVLALDVLPSADLRLEWDHVYRFDHQLVIARLAAQGRRGLDRISVAPSGFPVMALVGGHPEAPTALFSRLESMWEATGLDGVIICAFTRLDGEASPAGQLQDVLDVLARKRVDAAKPIRMV